MELQLTPCSPLSCDIADKVHLHLCFTNKITTYVGCADEGVGELIF